MSDPAFTPLHLGAVQDDDGQIIDALFEPNPNLSPPPVSSIDSTPLVSPVIPTRLISVSQVVDPAWYTPTLILPEDVKRKHLHIECFSDTASTTDYCVITSDVKGSTLGLAKLRHGSKIDLFYHTGAIRVLNGGSASLTIDAWSVTE